MNEKNNYSTAVHFIYSHCAFGLRIIFYYDTGFILIKYSSERWVKHCGSKHLYHTHYHTLWKNNSQTQTNTHIDRKMERRKEEMNKKWCIPLHKAMKSDLNPISG